MAVASADDDGVVVAVAAAAGAGDDFAAYILKTWSFHRPRLGIALGRPQDGPT